MQSPYGRKQNVYRYSKHLFRGLGSHTDRCTIHLHHVYSSSRSDNTYMWPMSWWPWSKFGSCDFVSVKTYYNVWYTWWYYVSCVRLWSVMIHKSHAYIVDSWFHSSWKRQTNFNCRICRQALTGILAVKLWCSFLWDDRDPNCGSHTVDKFCTVKYES